MRLNESHFVKGHRQQNRLLLKCPKLADSPYGGLVILGSDGSLNGPVPALLTAATRNSYSLPSIRSLTVKVVSETVSLFAFVHLVDEVSFFSTV